MEKQTVTFRDLGVMPYKEAWDYQEELLQENVKTKALLRTLAEATIETDASTFTTSHSPLATQHYLLFVEHPPVLTLGKSGNIDNVLISEELLKRRGVEFYRTNRGGDITFHGPQQVVGYPILDLERF